MCQLSGVDAFAFLKEIGFGWGSSPAPNLGFTPSPSSTEIAVVPTQAY